MTRFLVKRLIGLFFILIGVTFITFILGYLAPGDPIKESMGITSIQRSGYNSATHTDSISPGINSTSISWSIWPTLIWAPHSTLNNVPSGISLKMVCQSQSNYRSGEPL
ncbi:hypothetical protein [Dictyobacter kobayashii]|uniref:hypothetical protein n=1 Tax=Dictyobacter kobayashii TaxID=2014872 RepID=UPI001FEAB194|nr:hypothetical protein [Dictyobacter kobayashii]